MTVDNAKRCGVGLVDDHEDVVAYADQLTTIFLQEPAGPGMRGVGITCKNVVTPAEAVINRELHELVRRLGSAQRTRAIVLFQDRKEEGRGRPSSVRPVSRLPYPNTFKLIRELVDAGVDLGLDLGRRGAVDAHPGKTRTGDTDGVHLALHRRLRKGGAGAVVQRTTDSARCRTESGHRSRGSLQAPRGAAFAQYPGIEN